MHVAGVLSDYDSIREQLACFVELAGSRQKLGKLIISRYVIRIRFEKFLEILVGSFVFADLGAFERQTVTRERVRWFVDNKLFQNFSPRLLCLGHGLEAGIIAGLETLAKRRAYAKSENISRMPKLTKPNEAKEERPASDLPGKPVSASMSEMVEAVLPNDANALGNMLGGRVMHFIDIAGALAAHRHSNSHVVTASVDYLDFRFPISVGEIIVLKSSVNRVFRTSMEVGVKVFSENILTGERKHTSSAYVTFVAIDLNRQPHEVPPLILVTEDDRRRYREAGERRRVRLNMRHKRPLSDA